MPRSLTSDEKVRKLPPRDVGTTTGFIDLHQDMLSGVALLEGDFSVYGSNYLTGPCEATAIWSSLFPQDVESSLLTQLAAHDQMLRRHSAALRLITYREDLDADDRRTGVLPHSEGLHLPAIGPDALETLWSEHSLRSLSLTWNYETEYGFSCYDDNTAPLKPSGRQLVSALERSPLFLDVSHLNDAGFYEVLERYSPPVLATHSPCRSIVDHPRGLTDDQLRVLGDHGGLVGQAFCPDFLGQRGSVDEALRHLDRVASLAGENAVSIGSDWGHATMGELRDTGSLVGLVRAVSNMYGHDLAAKFAYANADAFLRRWLPTRSS